MGVVTSILRTYRNGGGEVTESSSRLSDNRGQNVTRDIVHHDHGPVISPQTSGNGEAEHVVVQAYTKSEGESLLAFPLSQISTAPVLEEPTPDEKTTLASSLEPEEPFDFNLDWIMDLKPQKRELEVREARLFELKPLLPLLPITRRLEDMGLNLQEMDLSVVLESWIGVIRMIMETERVDYEKAVEKLKQDLVMLKPLLHLTFETNFRGDSLTCPAPPITNPWMLGYGTMTRSGTPSEVWHSRKFALDGLSWSDIRDIWVPELGMSWGQAISALKKSWRAFKVLEHRSHGT